MDGFIIEIARTMAAHWSEVTAFASGSIAAGLGSAAGRDGWDAAKRVVRRHNRQGAPTVDELASGLGALVAAREVRVEDLASLADYVSTTMPGPTSPVVSTHIGTFNHNAGGTTVFGVNVQHR